MEQIMVSICCLTYNHENYIEDAIKGFLMQKTTFPIEIIIHDDASTDRTAEIIRRYEKEYPDLIKPVYQLENQHSKKTRILTTHVFPKCRGKYIALCDGDDYWIDPYKLQKQVDYMENHPDCTFCFHNAHVVNFDKTPLKKLHIPNSKWSQEYYYGNAHKYDAGQLELLEFIPSSSFLFLKKLILDLPPFYFNSIYDDAPLKLYLTSKGYAYYIDEVMSAYRTNVRDSVLDKQRKSVERRIKGHINYLNMLDEFDVYTCGKYSKELEESKLKREIKILMLRNNLKELKQEKYRPYYKTLRFVTKIKIHYRFYLEKLKKYFVS
ncbi:MAG: glycosyltransferase [Tissierellia bacterium]|nr:glycosyltransferase [Tissierellia bacterium]